MFEKFSDYMYSLLFTPLKKVKQTANQYYLFFKVIGKLFDGAKDDLLRVREESMIASASETMLPEHGRDREMNRLEGETVEGYRTRLSMKALIAERAGTAEGILLAIKAFGYQRVSLIPRGKEDRSRWAEAVIMLEFAQNTSITHRRLILHEANKIKPASSKLTLNSFEIIPMVNTGCFHLMIFSVRVRINNWMQQTIRFDGSIDWNGSVRWDQQISGRYHLRTLAIKTVLAETEKTLAAPVLQCRFYNREELQLNQLLLHIRASNYLRTPVRFNGTVSWDGKIQWDQQITDRFKLRRLTARQGFIQALHTSVCLRLPIVAVTNEQLKGEAVRYRSCAGLSETTSVPRTIFRTAFGNCFDTQAQLITNTMYRFNGEHQFDGTRRFNAARIREDF